MTHRLLLLAVLTLLLTACPAAQPPVDPAPDEPPITVPDTFPVTEVAGTLLNWTNGEAFVTLTGGYSETFIGDPEFDGVELSEPTYRGTLAADGSFSVPLSPPDAYIEDPFPFTLICENGESYTFGVLLLAVASSVPGPAQSDEVFGIYTLGLPDSLLQDAVWLYTEEALELDTACVLPGSLAPAAVALNLVSGWNQAILTLGETARLESGAVPGTFVWSER
ncbi:hypothetical protein [Truepera radiovictrix]|uniref:Uncharacterized protein n=1 Tax=Truepera radiovictrix (strain DSM 17093 / CIP 108686 / LMG 22925 / RQ-24) TaxID=649638 RepID=D7CSR4_TRURR|nr:hypothetical protein [Truepera radiovictrix]ADI13681.1 hypothetical protein Trad_0544 [Truepera radiovictrix DSM 17093]WMT57756.1 hypothetical protein RCV51_02130 [Truepera radiovictrix]